MTKKFVIATIIAVILSLCFGICFANEENSSNKVNLGNEITKSLDKTGDNAKRLVDNAMNSERKMMNSVENAGKNAVNGIEDIGKKAENVTVEEKDIDDKIIELSKQYADGSAEHLLKNENARAYMREQISQEKTLKIITESCIEK